MNINAGFQALKSAWYCREEVVICLLGAPGIGKTECVYSLRDWIQCETKYTDCKVVEIIASQILPTEVSGLTMPDAETHTMQIFDHARLSSLKDGDILFFDELLQAPMQVLSACLTLIQERRMMSGKKLPDVMIVAASNPLGSASSIPESIRQRFMFLDIDFYIDDWLEYIENRYGDYLDYDKLNEEKITLQNLFEKDRTCYNIITPRSVTKCIQWIIESPPECTNIRRVINNMFGYSLGDVLYKFIIKIDPMNQQIYDAIKDKIDVLDLEEFKENVLHGYDPEAIMKFLNDYMEETGLDIEGILDNIEYRKESVYV